MDSIHIQGDVALQGKVRIQGSKNASLPVLAAALLTRETSVLHNCPRIADVHGMVTLLKSIGCRVQWMDGGLSVNTDELRCGDLPSEAIRGMRSSLCLLGALLGRCGEVILEQPGGCVIGERPIDLHISALTKMGACFEEKAGRIHAFAGHLHGADIALPIPSVGATENILLAAVSAEGDTVIRGAAKEPEVTTLCRYLEACGALIEGIGTGLLQVKGGRILYGTDFRIPSDRIVAGTYLFGCIGAGGSVFLEDAPCNQLEAVTAVAELMGAVCSETEDGLFVQSHERPLPIPCLRTEGYPGFPTDLQSAALAVLCKASGESMIEESIFENRFRVVEPLKSMGADITLESGRIARVRGVSELQGSRVEAKELRGGAALVLAGLFAGGETTVTGCPFIYRGYENICKDLRELGARIASV